MAKGSSRDGDLGGSLSTGNWSGVKVDAPQRTAYSPPVKAVTLSDPVRPTYRSLAPQASVVVVAPRPAYDDSWSRGFTHTTLGASLSNSMGPLDYNSPNWGAVAVMDATGEVIGYRVPVDPVASRRKPDPVVVDPPPAKIQRDRRVSTATFGFTSMQSPIKAHTVSSLATVREPEKRTELKEEALRCKPRPKDNRPKKGGGARKGEFIPWCK